MNAKDIRNLYELDDLNLRIELARKNKSMAWLAREIGVTRQYIWALVKSKSISRVNDFARVLGVDPKILYTPKTDIF